MSDQDAELDAIVAMLEDADLIESYINEDGKPALRITERGAQVGRAMAIAGDQANAVLDVLLDAGGADTPTG